jgi:hypothetical protein
MNEIKSWRLKDGRLVIGHITSVNPLVDRIKNSTTADRQALPLRQKDPLPITILDREFRVENEKAFGSYKSNFLKENLLINKIKSPGIYFFFNKKVGLKYCYYIGIADSIKRRMGEHITRRDYIFYSLAFPKKKEKYLEEVLWFYGQKKQYEKYIDEYKRQTECLDCALFDSIAWLSSDKIPYCVWDLIETHFIIENQPCVNVGKKGAIPEKNYENTYLEVKDFVNDLIY